LSNNRINKIKRKHLQETGKEADIDTIAKEVNLSVDKVKLLLKLQMNLSVLKHR